MHGPAPERGVRGGNCAHCHGGAKLMQEVFHNNGLDSIAVADRGRQEITSDGLDNGRFRVVTLRNIALTAPYMHDGRFKTLTEVVKHYNTLGDDKQLPKPLGTPLDLSDNERTDLVLFLKTLTDNDFLSNPKFSFPRE